jgi:fatty acid synthase
LVDRRIYQQVFATVGSEVKKEFLLATFPELKEDHIGDSRSLSFEGLVRNVSKGKGVHLLLNSLSDEKLQVPPPPL